MARPWGEFPDVYLDAMVRMRSCAGRPAQCVGLGIGGTPMITFRFSVWRQGQKEDPDGGRGFLRHSKDRGLAGAQLIISDACVGLVEATTELRIPRLALCGLGSERADVWRRIWCAGAGSRRPVRAQLGRE